MKPAHAGFFIALVLPFCNTVTEVQLVPNCRFYNMLLSPAYSYRYLSVNGSKLDAAMLSKKCFYNSLLIKQL
jgi:hypothetical protein